MRMMNEDKNEKREDKMLKKQKEKQAHSKQAKQTKEGILFIDFDGTLVNSIKAHYNAFNLAFEKFKIPKINFDLFIGFFGFVSEEVVKRYFETIDLKKSNAEIKRIALLKTKYFLKKTFNDIKPFAKINSTLRKLSTKFFLVLETNASLPEIKKVAKKINLKLDLFDLIFSKEKIKHRKPDPELIKKALEIVKAGKICKEKIRKGKVENRILRNALKNIFVIGDTFVDVLLANNAKAKSILITKNKEKELKKSEEFYNVKCKADHVIKNFYEIEKILL